MPRLTIRILNGEMPEGFNFLTLPEEKKEVSQVGCLPRVRLEYVKRSKEVNTWMKDYGVNDGRMWNIVCIGHPFHNSTRTLDGLRELGVIP